MSLLNSNDYDRGYNDGYAAGFAGQEKNFIRSGMSLKFAVWGPDALNSYTEGYNKGYGDGCYDRNSKDKPQKVYTKDNTITKGNTNNNSHMVSYRKQIERLHELLSAVEKYKEIVESTNAKYKSIVENLHEYGLPDEMMEKMEEENFEPIGDAINSIIQIIEENTIPAINRDIDKLEDLL